MEQIKYNLEEEKEEKRQTQEIIVRVEPVESKLASILLVFTLLVLMLGGILFYTLHEESFNNLVGYTIADTKPEVIEVQEESYTLVEETIPSPNQQDQSYQPNPFNQSVLQDNDVQINVLQDKIEQIVLLAKTNPFMLLLLKNWIWVTGAFLVIITLIIILYKRCYLLRRKINHLLIEIDVLEKLMEKSQKEFHEGAITKSMYTIKTEMYQERITEIAIRLARLRQKMKQRVQKKREWNVQEIVKPNEKTNEKTNESINENKDQVEDHVEDQSKQKVIDEQMEQLLNYIYYHKKKRKSHEKIKQSLKDEGWPDEFVDMLVDMANNQENTQK